MNCKPGGLAVVVHVTNENIRPYLGRILRCVSLAADWAECWVTEPRIFTGAVVYDGALRPIRDQPGEDEILRIAGKPCDTKTPEAA